MPDKAIDVDGPRQAAYQRSSRWLKPGGLSSTWPRSRRLSAKSARNPAKHVSPTTKELAEEILDVICGWWCLARTTQSMRCPRPSSCRAAGLKSGRQAGGSSCSPGLRPSQDRVTPVGRKPGVELLRFDCVRVYGAATVIASYRRGPPGYVGFLPGLPPADRSSYQEPSLCVLLDESEKATLGIQSAAALSWDHGAPLTDNNGRKADFRTCDYSDCHQRRRGIMARSSIGFTQQDHSTDAMRIIKKPSHRSSVTAWIHIQFGRLSQRGIQVRGRQVPLQNFSPARGQPCAARR